MNDKHIGTINRFSSSMDFGSFGKGSVTKNEDKTKQDDQNKENNMRTPITFEQMKQLFDQQSDKFDARFSSLEKNMDNQFDAIDKKFDAIDKQFKEVNLRMDKFERLLVGGNIDKPEESGIIPKINSLIESGKKSDEDIKTMMNSINSINEKQTKIATSIKNFTWFFAVTSGLVIGVIKLMH